MSQSQTVTDSLHISQQYIGLFLKNLYTLDMEKLDTSQRLKILEFYEQLIGLLHDNTSIISPGEASLASHNKQKCKSYFNSS